MPLYSRKYRRGRLYYRAYKMRSNPLNKGRWDLLHWWGGKYNGLFYRSIKVKITLKDVQFTTNYSPIYMRDIYAIISKSKILGITKKQMTDAQIRNVPKIKRQIENIINTGRIR